MEREEVDHRESGCICRAMKRLWKEQKQLAGSDYQFVCNPFGMDTIPFMLYCKEECKKPFRAFSITGKRNDCFSTTFFRLEKLDEKKCCAVLSLLEAVDMDGTPVEACEDIYSLLKTDICLTVDLSCFCVISPLPPKLVNKPLPIIEPKC